MQHLAKTLIVFMLVVTTTDLVRVPSCAVQGEQPTIDFNRDIRPILSDKCYHCHGPDKAHRKADLRLDREEDAKADLGGYHAIAPGLLDDSELVRRITTDDVDERMPPDDSGKELSDNERAMLRRWIADGAIWSEPWSYMPPRRHHIPSVVHTDWPLNWIDHFVLARLESEGFAPASDADHVTLIRRLSFDLIGLPPAPEEVDAFLEDDSPLAYEKLVDRLLDSPHYGERMAMYWLDLVRYADTVGYHGDQDHNISPYRDYVINAFNDNMPLDQFTREQLAGDLLPNATLDQKIATGYNRMLQTSHEGGLQPKEYLAIYGADRVRNLSNVWMAATMGCCQCHDHKYDPYTAKDFYSMVAFFADIDEQQHFSKGSNSLPTNRPPELVLLSHEEKVRIGRLQQDISERKRELDELPPAAQQTGQVVTQATGPDPTALDQSVDPEQEDDGQEDDGQKVDRAAIALVAKRESLNKTILDIESQMTAIRKQAIKTMITVAIEPRTIRVLPRGDWMDDSGEIVEPAVPKFMPSLQVRNRRANRLDLANWLVDPEQGVGGLTARAFVNRYWYLCFGTGIARVMDDFGGQGEPPNHPALLDNLAIEFLTSGWDVKRIMKLLVMSRAYRQSSVTSQALRERDPYNQLTACQSRYRLSAEMIRDNALAVSGLLVRKVGGPSVRPYQPASYYGNLNFPERTYHRSTDQGQWRRGVYMHWQRQFLHPMLKAFDAPSREECTAQRPRSNTPLAALTLLNDPTFIEAARVFAQRIMKEGGSGTADRIDFAFRHAVSHRPDAAQRELLTRLLQSRKQQYATDPDAADQLLGIGISPVDTTVDPIELGAWTGVARAMLNMNESCTRN